MVVNDVRGAAQGVAEQARFVTINSDQIALYAASLPGAPPLDHALIPDRHERAHAAAHWLTLDAINFGSGWFPTLRKRPGRTGYATVAAGIQRRFQADGPWSADELAHLTAPELGAILDQDPTHELVDLWVDALRDLGAHLRDDYGGDVLGPIDAAAGSAVALVEILARWNCFADVSAYAGRAIPFYKRAQIAAADLARAGAAQFGDLDRLTMFADNLVPHVLRLDGILDFDPGLVERIEREDLIEHGSPEEVEIRACAVHAVELIVQASPEPVTAAQLDQLLWQRGQGRLYKSSPRHRSRSTAY